MNNQIEIEAKEYLKDDKTVAETAEIFEISKRTLQLHLKKLSEINPELHKLVLNKQKSNIIAGRIKGGTLGKSGVTYTQEEVTKIAEYMIHTQATYEEASNFFDIPTSTIHDMMRSPLLREEYKMQLEVVAESNRKKISTEELLERNKKIW